MKNNHGKVGEALYLKFTPEKFKELSGGEHKHGEILSSEQSWKLYGATGIPVHIDKDTKGNYECVCEFGTEVH